MLDTNEGGVGQPSLQLQRWGAARLVLARGGVVVAHLAREPGVVLGPQHAQPPPHQRARRDRCRHIHPGTHQAAWCIWKQAAVPRLTSCCFTNNDPSTHA